MLASNVGHLSAVRFVLSAAAGTGAAAAPAQAAAFQKFSGVKLRWDADFLFIESNGMPDHNMMVGITAWQQQVPLPQTYSGENAWRIPLHPVVAKEPASIKGRFLRGAIALAANGIPIFNPQNNRGEISAEIGELDQWGGHCGRADDYHYHAAPLHLQSVVGKGLPIAYALDGYPIYGLTEPDGSAVSNLDACNGHETSGAGYHYHASLKYPYVNGGFHGEVVEREQQVDPQPRAQPVRPDTAPLRGAEITGFESTGSNSYKLSYAVRGDQRSISYSINPDGTYPFVFDNGSEGTVKEVYTQRRGGGGGGGGGKGGPGAGEPGGKGKGPGRGDGGKEMRPDDSPPPPLPVPERAAGSVPEKSAGSIMDLNGDGLVSGAEFASAAKLRFGSDKSPGTLADAMQKARSAFIALDRNKDGQIDKTEFDSPDTSSSPSSAAPASEAGTSGRERPRRGDRDGRSSQPAAITPDAARSNTGTFVLTSPEVTDGGNLPADYTGDGSGATLPLEWKGAPAGTQSFALIMDHLAPGNEMKGYWNVWDIPADVTSLPKNAKGVGKVGVGFRGEVGYEPPHSKGPGAKTYVIHVYALSGAPKIEGDASSVNREVLLAAIKDKILATADLHVVYTRGNPASDSGAVRPEGGQRPKQPEGGGKGKPQDGLIKPSISDTMKLNVYADNWFMLYVNGRLVAVDPIQFTPHNVVSVDFLPEYPMTIAVLAKDNADPKSGLEYGTNIGDGGFILKFADGTVTNATWKAKNFFLGPVNRDIAHPRVKQEPLPANWWTVDFDDSTWAQAKEYSVEEVDPKQPYFDHDFSGAKFIWTDDLALDNTVIFRTRIEKPDWEQRWNTKPDLDVTGAPQQ